MDEKQKDYNIDFGKRIARARKELDLTMDELGKLVNLHESTIQRYEKGRIKSLDIEKAVEFAKALKINPLDLLDWNEPNEYTNSILIPVYGKIPAGKPIKAIENIEEYIDIPVIWLKGDKKFIALRVTGDSMYPKYLEGDTVVIQMQCDCESGQDCAVYVNGFDVTLKTVFKQADKIVLKPVNPNYPPKTFNVDDDIHIIGIVKELRRNIV